MANIVRRRLTWLVAVVLALALLRFGTPLLAETGAPDMEVTTGLDSSTLVVAIHGFAGQRSLDGMVNLARAAYPNAHVLAPLFLDGRLRALSNQNPYRLADNIEVAIDEAYRTYRYERIVLIGHSMGGELIRKAFVWGAGYDEDRPGGRRGKHPWTDHVERFVSLASINRGWSVNPRPPGRGWLRQLQFSVGTSFGALTNTGHLVFGVQRGSPFVADLRVQWIRMARSPDSSTRLPFVIHLLGTNDDIASLDDSKDSQAAKGFKFKSLSNTDHGDIAAALTEEIQNNRATSVRARKILEAVTLPPDEIETDAADPLVEQPNVRRVLFILHGIRDYDYWGKQLEHEIESALGPDSSTAIVVPKYGHFPMMPFLLWSDRQEKVRWFMDVFTETLAQYPSATAFDFIGHSNGTYILASALQKYTTLQVRDVYFAGSVVPQRYPWSDLIRAGRVHRVRNVVATGDWVVAIFPRLFEQIAEWRNRSQVTGADDLGAAGFRGFRFFGEPKDGVRDFTFATGGHGTGVAIDDAVKRQALVRFAQFGVDAEQDGLFAKVFENSAAQSTALDIASNISWAVWLIILLIVGGLGYVTWRWNKYAAIGYALFVLALLNSL
jgi:pimeloyl-ACP methyl ester carboxylesterase